MEALRASFMFKLLLAASHFSICLSRCVGGHVYQVGNVLPPAGGVELQRVIGGLTLKLRCIELCNGIPDCYSMFYNETSADCYLNDHTAFRVSAGGETNLTYIGWKTRCDETGKCTSLKTCNGAIATTTVYNSCSSALMNNRSADGSWGYYYIDPDGAGPLAVQCRYKANYSWTVIQQRSNNQTNFYRGWDEYKNGFGSPNGNHWLGLQAMYRIASTESYQLRLRMSFLEAKYSFVKLSNESDYYKLQLGFFTGGNVGDSMGGSSNGSYFSTFDADHDNLPSTNCAATYHGGWWYGGDCRQSNLNGPYKDSCNETPGDCMIWAKLTGLNTSVNNTLIMLGSPLVFSTP